MKELTYLSPAETLLILDPAYSTTEELARLTFLDLVLRKILAVELKDTSDENSEKIKKLRKIVTVGSNFKNYKSAKHEAIFLNPFDKDYELKISLRNLIKAAFEGIKADEYKLKFVYNSRISMYFSANFIQLIIGAKRINEKGLELQKRMSDYLSRMDIELKSSKENMDILEERLLSLNGNILLLKNIDNSVFEVLKESDKNKAKNNKGDDLPWHDYGLLYMWGPHSPANNFNVVTATTNTFRDTIDSFDTIDSSRIDSTGVSEDGGCSGCGGCGGCS